MCTQRTTPLRRVTGEDYFDTGILEKLNGSRVRKEAEGWAEQHFRS